MAASLTTTTNEIATLATQGWVSLNKFAKIVGISYPTAVKLMNEGEIKSLRVGGMHRINADEIKRFLIEGTKKKRRGEKSPRPS